MADRRRGPDAAAARLDGLARPAAPGGRDPVRRGGVPVAARPAIAVEATRGDLLRARPARRRDRLRAGRVADRDVRRQLQLAWTGVVADQLPRHPGAAPVRPVLRRGPPGRVPHRLGAAADPAARSPATSPTGWSSIWLPGRRRSTSRATGVRTSSTSTRRGGTTCCSSSTSTATSAPASAPRTRPGGPRWSPTSSSTRPSLRLKGRRESPGRKVDRPVTVAEHETSQRT